MTARFDILTSIESPWLVHTSTGCSELEHELDMLKGDSRFTICLLDGHKMATINGVFEEFARGLKFPDYFGFNSDAFDECLTDLSWLNARGICIVILASEQLLKNEIGEIGWLLEVLEDASKEWAVAVEESEAWDRPAIPFHVVFHATTIFAERLPSEIAALPLLELLPPLL